MGEALFTSVVHKYCLEVTKNNDITNASKLSKASVIKACRTLCTVDFFPSVYFIPKHLELNASLQKLTKFTF